MSVKLMSEVFERSKTQGNARLVLLALADSCNDDACCWPSIRKLAEKANVSEPILKKYLNALIEVGVVTRDEREDASGRQTSNLYTINVERIGSDLITQNIIHQASSPSRIKSFEGVTGVSVGGGNPGYPIEGVTGVSLSIMNRHIESSIEPPRKETSAMASDSKTELVSPKGTDVDADAESGKSDDLISRPPSHHGSCVAKNRKSPPIDDAKLSNFRSKANKLFNRRETTAWSNAEIKAAIPHLDTPEDEWDVLTRYYAKRGQKDFFPRTSLITLLNNWGSEIDKAKAKFPDEENNPDFWRDLKPRD